jgi:hypothetical protein
MGNFDSFADSPFQIKLEGQEITLAFDRTTDTEGVVSWNIPTPSAGCTSETQAYCGMVVTLKTGEPSNIADRPVEGTLYEGDPTGDSNLHAGDTIGNALVIGAFYEGVKKGTGETLTTSFTVSDLSSTEAYYISGYAVDCQNRYHTQGVHAYSQQYGDDGSPDTSGYQIIEFRDGKGINGSSGTGLSLTKSYKFTIKIDGYDKSVTVAGSDAQTYDQLIDSLNNEIEKLSNAPQSPVPPNSGAYWYDTNAGKLYQWDGYANVEIAVLNEPTDPTALAVGDYWYDTENSQMNKWNGSSWIPVDEADIIRYRRDLADTDILDSTDYWYKPASLMSPGASSSAYQWCGNIWCMRTLFDQTVDPSEAAAQTCGSYWYNPDDMLLRQWNEETCAWVATDAVYWDKSPLSLTSGTFWFNDETNTLFEWNTPLAGVWNDIAKGYVDVELSATHSSSDNALADGVYNETISVSGTSVDIEINVCNSKEGRFDSVLAEITSQLNAGSPGLAVARFRDSEPSKYIRIESLSASAPQIQAGGTLFSSLTDWMSNGVSTPGQVVTVGDEPTVPQSNQYWFDTESQELFQRDAGNTAWDPICAILFDRDPTDISSCDLWWNSDNDMLYVFDTVAGSWTPVEEFTQGAIDPSSAPTLDQGVLWYSSATEALKEWDGAQWVAVSFVSHGTDPTNPSAGDVWFNTETEAWSERSGSPGEWESFDPVDSPYNPSQMTIQTGKFWYDTMHGQLFQWNGTNWVSIMFGTEPLSPEIGDLWYDTTTDTLFAWNGSAWEEGTPKAIVSLVSNGIKVTSTNVGSDSAIWLTDDTEWRVLRGFTKLLDAVCGVDGLNTLPNYAVEGIGTDGTTDERRELHDLIRNRLGYPEVEVELTKAQIDYAIDRAIKELRRYSASPYRRGFMMLNIKAGVQRYWLNSPGRAQIGALPQAGWPRYPYPQTPASAQQWVGYDKIVQVMGVFRVTAAFMTSAHGSGIFGQVVLQHLYNMGTFDLLSYHLVSQYIEQLEHLFASRVVFNWNETDRTLWLHQVFSQNERAIMDVAVERSEQDLLKDRFTGVWIERYSIAQAKLILSQKRGKYSTLPGAGGGVSLNASDLYQQAMDEIDRLMSEVEDFVTNNVEEFGQHTTFIIG